MKSVRLFSAVVLLLLASCGGGGGGIGSNFVPVPEVQAQNPVPGTILHNFCQTPHQMSGFPVWVLGLGPSGDCTTAASGLPRAGVILTSNGRLANFRFKATTTVALTGAVYVNGSQTALQCTIAAGGNLCVGPATTVVVFDTDEVAIGVTSMGAGAFSNIRVSVEKQQ